MLEVKPEGLAFDMERLQGVLTEQTHILEDIERIKKILETISGLDEQRDEILRESNLLETEWQEVAFMLRGLDEIRNAYLNTELRVCDNADELDYTTKRLGTVLRTGILDHRIKQVTFI